MMADIQILKEGFKNKPYESEVRCLTCYCEWVLKESQIKSIIKHVGWKYFDFEYNIKEYCDDDKTIQWVFDSPRDRIFGNVLKLRSSFNSEIECPNCKAKIAFNDKDIPPIVKSRINRYIYHNGEYHKICFKNLTDKYCIVNVVINFDNRCSIKSIALFIPTESNVRKLCFIEAPCGYLFSNAQTVTFNNVLQVVSYESEFLSNKYSSSNLKAYVNSTTTKYSKDQYNLALVCKPENSTELTRTLTIITEDHDEGCDFEHLGLMYYIINWDDEVKTQKPVLTTKTKTVKKSRNCFIDLLYLRS